LLTIYVLGIFKTVHDSPVNGVSPARLIWAVIFATATFYLLGGLFGKNLGFMESFLPVPKTEAVAMGTTANGAPAPALNWLTDLDKAIEAAKKENKNIFLDFSGEHCKNCKLMERNTFPKPEVSALLSKMVTVKLITDMPDEASQKAKAYQQDKFNSVALPLYVIISPDGNVIAQSQFTNSVEEFTAFLKKGVK
jgi:thiol:disulfide interchange protein DsbD